MFNTQDAHYLSVFLQPNIISRRQEKFDKLQIGASICDSTN